MASVSQLVDGISKALGEPRDKANKYARALIDAGLLPKSSGRAVAQVELVHFVRLLTAISLQPKIKDTGAVVLEYLSLPMGATSEEGERINRDMNCEEMLVMVFTSALSGKPENMAKSSIQFVTNFPLVEVVMRAPTILEDFLGHEMAIRCKPDGVSIYLDDLAIRRSVIVYADLVKDMGFDLGGDGDDG